jgi:putative ABC transport system substrate-binding protein
MRRRDFMTLLGGGAFAWPVMARAEGALPVIGFMHTASPDRFPHLPPAFRQGLSEVGYVEGQNVSIEYRWAEGHYDRLPQLAADLTAHQVNVLAATGGDESALAAKSIASTIPIVFQMGNDPVRLGLVASLNRPGGRITGSTLLSTELAPKRLELLHDLLPKATKVAVLINPSDSGAESQARELQEAARVLAIQVHVLRASKDDEIGRAFTAMVEQGDNALVVQSDPFFTSRRDQLVGLANRHALPAMYGFREFTAVGGLISYGADLEDVFRQTGIYAGRILKGQEPANLPVSQPTKFDLVINLKTANALGITVPLTLQVFANEVIE